MPCVSLFRSATLLGLLIGLAGCGAARSHTNSAVSVSLTSAYPLGKGPVVLWDLGHHNYDAGVLGEAIRAWISRDGYVVRPFDGPFDKAILSQADIVVIRLALAAVNEGYGNWTLPTPSAFSRSEIDALASWVSEGGALLLSTEHMPFGGAVEELASAFDIEVLNAFVFVDTTALADMSSESLEGAGTFMYRRTDGSLGLHPVTNGRGDAERIDSLMVDGSTAFRLPSSSQSVVTLGSYAVALFPEVAHEFHENTPWQDIGGWSQVGVMRVGRGRVAVLGEGFLLTSPEAIDPSSPDFEAGDERGHQHPQFTLNLLHWLSGLLPNE